MTPLTKFIDEENRSLTSAVDGISVAAPSSAAEGKDIFDAEANFSNGEGVGLRVSQRLCFSTSSI